MGVAMKRMILPMAAALALAGCGSMGGGEDFALTVKRPVAQVVVPFSDAQLPAEARALFPGLKVDRSRPSDNEVLYTFPVEGKEPGIVRLVFESTAEGKATVVHATVDVPQVTANINGVLKVISEAKVERELKKLIENSTTDLEAGSSGESARREFAQLLAALAIATNKQAMARAQELLKDPMKAAVAMSSLGGSDYFDNYDAERDAETADRPEGSGDEVMEDPNDRLEREEVARDRAEYREDRALRSNSAANDDAEGASTTPRPDRDVEY
jgi:hypothetical protein